MTTPRTSSVVAAGLLAAALLTPAGRASAQAVGFAPVIGGAPSGVGLNVTPVATADRRYVRLGGLNATFTDVLGFDTAVVTGAVGGGGIGGGFGLPGGFGVGGFRSVGVGAGGFGGVPYGYGPGYGGYPVGYGYGAYPYGYGAYPYGYGSLGGVRIAPPPQARTVNGLGALGIGITNAAGRGSWNQP